MAYITRYLRSFNPAVAATPGAVGASIGIGSAVAATPGMGPVGAGVGIGPIGAGIGPRIIGPTISPVSPIGVLADSVYPLSTAIIYPKVSAVYMDDINTYPQTKLKKN